VIRDGADAGGGEVVQWLSRRHEVERDPVTVSTVGSAVVEGEGACAG